MNERASGRSVGETSILRATFAGQKGAAGRYRPRLERLEEPGLQECAELGRSFEVRNGIQFFECPSERIGKTPDRSRPELLVLWLEVQVMHGPGKGAWGLRVYRQRKLRRSRPWQ
jgi:hypothetical protein